jgi:ParB family chromosome partitioning protein
VGARPRRLPRPPPEDLPHHRGGGGEAVSQRQGNETLAPAQPLAHLAEELDGPLTNPESLSQQRLLRIDAAFRAGFDNVVRTALAESSLDGPQTQWQILLPILTEAEQPPSDTPTPRPSRPRRVYRPRKGLTIRREQTRDGYVLHFTGGDADSDMLDAVFDEIERIFTPE